LSQEGCFLEDGGKGSPYNYHNVPDVSWQHGSSVVSPVRNTVILQFFDAVGWATGRASGLYKFCHNSAQEFTFGDWLTWNNSRKLGQLNKTE